MLKDPSFIYLATILPPILLGFIIWKSDKFPEPGKFLVASFLLGVSIIFPLDLFIRVLDNKPKEVVNKLISCIQNLKLKSFDSLKVQAISINKSINTILK